MSHRGQAPARPANETRLREATWELRAAERRARDETLAARGGEALARGELSRAMVALGEAADRLDELYHRRMDETAVGCSDAEELFLHDLLEAIRSLPVDRFGRAAPEAPRPVDGWGPDEPTAIRLNDLRPHPSEGRAMGSAEYRDMRELEGELRRILVGWGYGTTDTIGRPHHSSLFSTVTYELACAALLHYHPEKRD